MTRRGKQKKLPTKKGSRLKRKDDDETEVEEEKISCLELCINKCTRMVQVLIMIMLSIFRKRKTDKCVGMDISDNEEPEVYNRQHRLPENSEKSNKNKSSSSKNKPSLDSSNSRNVDMNISDNEDPEEYNRLHSVPKYSEKLNKNKSSSSKNKPLLDSPTSRNVDMNISSYSGDIELNKEPHGQSKTSQKANSQGSSNSDSLRSRNDTLETRSNNPETKSTSSQNNKIYQLDTKDIQSYCSNTQNSVVVSAHIKKNDSMLHDGNITISTCHDDNVTFKQDKRNSKTDKIPVNKDNAKKQNILQNLNTNQIRELIPNEGMSSENSLNKVEKVIKNQFQETYGKKVKQNPGTNLKTSTEINKKLHGKEIPSSSSTSYLNNPCKETSNSSFIPEVSFGQKRGNNLNSNKKTLNSFSLKKDKKQKLHEEVEQDFNERKNLINLETEDTTDDESNISDDEISCKINMDEVLKDRSNEQVDNISSETINILLLGPSGVGKSTWVNSLYTYNEFDTMSSAENCSIPSVIETVFTIMDDDFESRVVRSSDLRPVEENVGSSQTKDCGIYRLEYNDRLIQFIDTPGLGDTAGLMKDQENLKKIINCLSKVPCIHGICILLKPNESKLSALFRFCIRELLSRLHEDAKDNILFLFTNSRSTFYRPGDTYPVLLRILEELKVDVTCRAETVYCIDNEAFRYLCTCQLTNVSYTDAEKASFLISWNKSQAESNRLLKQVSSLKPHTVNNTLLLNTGRNLVSCLIAVLSNILTSLYDNLNRKVSKFQITQNQKSYLHCVKCSGKVCESPCYINPSDLFPNEQIKNATVMDKNFCCKVCSCSWDSHRVFYCFQNVGQHVTKQQFIYEKHEILHIGSLLVKYIKQHSMTVYPDVVKSHILDLQEQEKRKVQVTNCGQYMLENLETVYTEYCTLSDVLEENDIILPLNAVDILKKYLFSLPICGSYIVQIYKPS